jgi:hypothetical protein
MNGIAWQSMGMLQVLAGTTLCGKFSSYVCCLLFFAGM